MPPRSAPFPHPMRGFTGLGWALVGVTVWLLPGGRGAFGATAPQDAPSFRRDIAPILAAQCLTCHGPDKQKGGYRVDTFTHLFEAGDSDAVPVVPGSPAESLLYQRLVTANAEDRMPQDGEALDPAVIERIRVWIAAGAVFDGPDPAASLAQLGGLDSEGSAPRVYPFPVPALAVAFADEATLLIGGYREVVVRTVEGRLVSRMEVPAERVHRLAVRPGGGRAFFSGGTPGRAGVAGSLDLEAGRLGAVWQRAADVFLAAALAPDGTRLAVAGADRTIRILDARDGSLVRTLGGHADWVLDLAFSPEGDRLVSASRDRTARVFELAGGALVCAFRAHEEAVTAAVFAGTGEFVVSAGRDGRLRVWSASDAKQVKASGRIAPEAGALRVVADRVLSVWSDGKLREHRWKDLERVDERELAGDRLVGLAASEGGRWIAAGAHDGSVRVWPREDPQAGARFVAVPLGVDSGGGGQP